LALSSLDFVAWIKPEKEGEFCMVTRELPWLPVGHFVPFPNARANDSQSETLWHTFMFFHFCFQLSSFSFLLFPLCHCHFHLRQFSL
jgi:hypothetical protein